MGAMLADTPHPSLAPIFMGEGGTKGDHRVITRISSRQNEAVHYRSESVMMKMSGNEYEAPN